MNTFIRQLTSLYLAQLLFGEFMTAKIFHTFITHQTSSSHTYYTYRSRRWKYFPFLYSFFLFLYSFMLCCFFFTGSTYFFILFSEVSLPYALFHNIIYMPCCSHNLFLYFFLFHYSFILCISFFYILELSVTKGFCFYRL